ncbi:MAG: hypothetical protein QXU32_00730 [Nitrososphaerales archaeon]
MSDIYMWQFSEGLAPLSHDSSIERAIRKHKTPRARRHMKGSDLYRRSDPVKRVLARLKRPSRHQPKPEVAEMLLSILRGNVITEDDLDKVSDKHLLSNSIDLLIAIALGGWEKHGNIITNGYYCIESNDFDVMNEQLLYLGKPIRIDWNRLYSIRDILNRRWIHES